MHVSLGQVFISVLGAMVGAVPGFLCWWLLSYGAWGIFVSIAGAFVGCALTLPSVSGKRVLGGTASMVVGNISPEWGDRLFEVIASDAEEKSRSPGSTPSESISASSSPLPARDSENTKGRSRERSSASEPLSVSSWLTGLLALSLMFIATYCQVMERQKKTQINIPTLSKEASKKLADDISRSQELHSIVLGNRPIPKMGQRDRTEESLQIMLAHLRQKPDADPRQIERLEKSLKYWRERKEEKHRQESPSPSVPEVEKASGVEATTD